MEERSIYISSIDRERVGRSVKNDFKIKLQTLKLQCSSKISELRIRVPYARTARMLTYAYAYVDIRVCVR